MAEGKQYIVDENREKTAVVLPMDEYKELMDHLEDLAEIAERRDQPTKSLDELAKS